MSDHMSAPSMRKKSFARSVKPKLCVREQRSVITMSSPEVCWPVPMRAIGAQNLLTMPGGVASAGYLHKKGGSQFSLMKWPLRYIIIHKGCVYYFKSSTSAAPQGAFSLNGYNRVMRAAEETTSSNVFPFKIVHFSKKHRTWFFSAASEKERRKWMQYLRKEIDHYNDRKDSVIPSDSDSDADSFYGSIERPMDITHHDSNADHDYIEEDEDDDEEDYLKPDAECSTPPPARHTGPPPSYPPPPVPATFQFRQESTPGFPKSLPPPVLLPHRIPTSPLPKKPPPPFPPPSILKDPNKGPPPPPGPFISHKPLPSEAPPPQPSLRKPPQMKPPSIGDQGNGRRDWRPLSTVSNHSTLPICEQLEARMVLNGPGPCSLDVGGSQSLGSSYLRHKTPPPPPPHQSPSPGVSPKPVRSDSLSPNELSPCHSPPPGHLPPSPLLKPGPNNKPSKPPPPAIKPPTPATKPKQQGTFIQRSSPEGQSFRSSGEEVPPEFRRKRDRAKGVRGDDWDDDEDDDYENVQLPDTVYINTTETSFVEKLFREGAEPPEDGLYGIRNSGTKTSKVLVVWDVALGKARNYRLFEDDECIFLDCEMTFPSLAALIEHYHKYPLPHHTSLCLQKPFTKTLST